MVPYLQHRSTVRKQKESQLSFKALLVGFRFGGCWSFFLFFFFYFTHPISYPGLQLLAHAKGRQVFAPTQQSSAKTRHLSFPATEGSRAREGSEPCKGRSPLPAQCKLLEKSTEREAPPNPVNAESWLGRTRRCRGWRCLQCRKSSSGTRQHFEPTERLSMFVPRNVGWMCHTRGKGNPRL